MKYINKPVEVEARQLSPSTRDDISRWVNGGPSGGQNVKGYLNSWYYESNGDSDLYVKNTEEGTYGYSRIGTQGDWIVEVSPGNFKVVFDSIFKKTYEPIPAPRSGLYQCSVCGAVEREHLILDNRQ